MKARLVACIMALLSIGASTPAQAHLFLPPGDTAVDGNEIRYGDSTQWDVARNHSIGVWCYAPIIIAPDAWNTYEDLTFRDVNGSDYGWAGYYQPSTGTDDLYYNTWAFNQFSTARRNAVAAHEMGHALNLAHNDMSPFQLMNSLIAYSDGSVNTPQSHDVQDFNERW